MRVEHTFPPFFPPESTILILGSFPSVVSRQQGFYYMHPQNRFYRVLESIYGLPFYQATIEEKKRYLSQCRLALYDVVESCEIQGSDDQSIRSVQPIHLSEYLQQYPIRKIIVNGKKAYQIFQKYFSNYVSIAVCAPSTSPANAAWHLDALIEKWKALLKNSPQD